jgi:hypothetical protein
VVKLERIARFANFLHDLFNRLWNARALDACTFLPDDALYADLEESRKLWMKFKPNNDTKAHSLTHLEPFEHRFQVAAIPGKPAREYRVLMEFTMHCFTKTQQVGDDPALFYSPDRDGTNRMFNLERWALSKELPFIIRSLAEHRIHFTNSRDHYKVNFITIPLVLHDQTEVEYEVYFKVFKARKKLRLEVESAYVRDPQSRNNRSVGRKISLYIILEKVSQGQNLAKLRDQKHNTRG